MKTCGFVALATIITFVIGTAEAKVILNSPLATATSASPGEFYTGSIELNNPGSEAATVRLYQTDYSFQADGSNSYGPAGAQQRSNAGWISLPSDHVSVPATTRISVSYTVLVPDHADLRGTYWSMIMVEPIPDSSPELSGDLPEHNGVRLTTVVRYGVQVISELEGEASGLLELADPTLTHTANGHRLAIAIRNPGERSLSPAMWLQLYDPEGRPMARAEADAVRVFPGCSVRFQLEVGELEPGRYQGLAVADAGDDDVFGVNLDLLVEVSAAQPAATPED